MFSTDFIPPARQSSPSAPQEHTRKHATLKVMWCAWTRIKEKILTLASARVLAEYAALHCSNSFRFLVPSGSSFVAARCRMTADPRRRPQNFRPESVRREPPGKSGPPCCPAGLFPRKAGGSLGLSRPLAAHGAASDRARSWRPRHHSRRRRPPPAALLSFARARMCCVVLCVCACTAGPPCGQSPGQCPRGPGPAWAPPAESPEMRLATIYSACALPALLMRSVKVWQSLTTIYCQCDER